MTKLSEVPTVLQENIFAKVLSIAEISNLNEEDMKAYEASLKDKRDWKNAVDYVAEEAKKEGIIEGKKEGRKAGIEEVARQLKKVKMPAESIAQVTGLSVCEIQKL